MADISSILHGGYHYGTTRAWQAERTLQKTSLMYPIFIIDDPDKVEPIPSMPGQYRWGLNKLKSFLEPLVAKGLCSVILFGVPLIASKDSTGTNADTPSSPVVAGIQLLRREFPDLLVACDVCLCEYTDHGHCGILREDGTLDNVLSVRRIAEVAVNYARAGAQVVAPSDMMDGRVKAIKQGLIDSGLAHKTLLMAYSAKFSGAFYGPFREAAGSAPQHGDRKCYQLPPGARGLARRAIQRDMAEGADVIMVKPGMPYLDIVREAADLAKDHPIAVYQVSGEYSMLWRSAEAGVFELKAAVMESLEGFLRAGATVVLSYYTPQVLEWLNENK